MNPSVPPAPRRKLRLFWSAWAVLAAGLGSAVAIYFTAGPAPANPLGYDPLDTKTYVRELELYGGKANLLGLEIRAWFWSLWHGRGLAYTVAVLSAIGAFLLWFVATHEIPPFPKEDE